MAKVERLEVVAYYEDLEALPNSPHMNGGEIYHLLLCPVCKKPTTLGQYYHTDFDEDAHFQYLEDNGINTVYRSYASLYSLIPHEDTPANQALIVESLVTGTRPYIERVVHQINVCYLSQCFDACAVLIRRLIETLIIEVYEENGRSKEIKDANDNFSTLQNLIDKISSDKDWNLSRNVREALPKFKKLGDQSAHSRYFEAKKEYLSQLEEGLRVTIPELLNKAKLNT